MNLCRACGEDFSSVATFDAHRVGKHAYTASAERPDGRRCLSPAEMRTKGWTVNVLGRWMNAARSEVGARMLSKQAA